MIFETNDLVIGYDEPLTKPLNIRMERGERIALTGANGIGKTTLLKSILQLIKPYSGEVHLGDYQHIGYFEQESDTQNTSTCIEEIWSEFPAMTQYEIRSMLAKCGLTTKHIESQVRVLSGGEQAKVRLCKILNRESNILLLDEPTNHLDAESIDWLEQHLQQYKGTVIAVTHDRYFLDNVAGWILELDRGEGIPWKGNYSGWLEQKTTRMAMEEKQESKRRKTLERELEWVRMSPSGRHAKSKARLSAYDKLMNEDTKQKEEKLEIFIPNGPRLGDVVIEAHDVSKAFGDRVLYED